MGRTSSFRVSRPSVTATRPRVARARPPRTQPSTPIAVLQSAVGNQGVLQLLRSSGNGPGSRTAPTGMQVSQPTDRSEREADSAAKALVPDSVNGAPAATAALTPTNASANHRSNSGLEGLMGAGQRLRPRDQQSFGARLGHDFGDVRIHQGEQAATLASNLKARAFTVGRDVVFNKGEYQPGRFSGARLLAHELTHVAQQGNDTAAGSAGTVMRTPQDDTEQGQGPQLQMPQLGDSLGGRGDPAARLHLGATIPPPVVVRHERSVSATVFFGQDRFLMDAANLAAVQQLNNELRTMLRPTVTVDGHASGEGSAEHNLQLSNNRRHAVIAMLSAGLSAPPVFRGTAHGEAQPPIPEDATTPTGLEQQRARNRRVQITIIPQRPVTPGPDAGSSRQGPPVDITRVPPEPPPPLAPRRPQLPPNFWTIPPVTPPQRQNMLSDLSRWLTEQLGREDIARLGGRIAGGLGMDESSVRRRLNDAMVSGGEAGLKAALRALIQALAGPPSSPEPSSDLPGTRIFRGPTIRF